MDDKLRFPCGVHRNVPVADVVKTEPGYVAWALSFGEWISANQDEIKRAMMQSAD